MDRSGRLPERKEPILQGREKDKEYTALRVLYFSCDNRRSALVRYESGHQGCRRRSILLYGQSPEEIAKTKEVEAPKKELDGVMSVLEKIGFWKMPKDDRIYIPPPSSDNNKNTGTHWNSIPHRGDQRGQVLRAAALRTTVQDRGAQLLPFVHLYTDVFQQAGLWKKSAK